MKLPLFIFAALLFLSTSFAQQTGWKNLDWRTVPAATVKTLIGSSDRSEWERIELTKSNDPGRHFAPGATSALLLALCYSIDLRVIDALLGAGAGADGVGPDSPLMYAARFNPNPAVIKALVAGGAKIRADLGYQYLQRPALTYAAQYNPNPDVIAEIVAEGGLINAKVSVLDNMGLTPLMYAAQYNRNPAVILELLKAGAKVDLPDAMGRTALIFAAEYNENPEVLKTLLAGGAGFNFVSRDYYNVDWTPLMYAAASEAEALPKIGILLGSGADARAKSREGKTALDYANANAAIPRDDPIYGRLRTATK